VDHVYISGKITGDPDFRKKFKERELMLKRCGYNPVNPTNYDEAIKRFYGHEPTYEEYLEYDLKLLSMCDKINFLPNYKDSKGAMIEKEYAIKNGIPEIIVKELPRKW